MPEPKGPVTFYSISEAGPEGGAEHSTWASAVEIILVPGVAKCEGDACDWFSGLLSENPEVLDWGHIRNSPYDVLVPNHYHEGESLDHAMSERCFSEGETLAPKRFLVCHPFVGAVGTTRGTAAEVSEFLTDRALMDFDAATLAEFLEKGAVGDDVRVSNAVVIRQQ